MAKTAFTDQITRDIIKKHGHVVSTGEKVFSEKSTILIFTQIYFFSLISNNF